jgi:small multidrug resistance family-3 protein
MTLKLLAGSIAGFLTAGLLEIGGGYLVWVWLRERRPAWVGLLGAVALVAYGAVPTLQPAHFGRVYAAYGGVFVVLSLLWGWGIDGHRPDRWDRVGAALCLAGVTLIMYAPRPGRPESSRPAAGTSAAPGPARAPGDDG